MTQPASPPTVLLTLPLHPQAEAALASFATVVHAPNTRPETLIHYGRQAHAVIVRSQLPDDMFTQCPLLKIAVRHGTGVDMIPLPQAAQAQVAVANVPGVNAQSVAEYGVWAILGIRRKLFSVTSEHRKNAADIWSHARAFANDGQELGDCTVGILGFGAVAQTLSRMLHALGVRNILVWNRSPVGAEHGVRQCALDDVLAGSDVVVLALPLTAETDKLINADRISTMRRGAAVVNLARGAIIDDDALKAALQSGHLGFAVLDVFRSQPLPNSSAWWTEPHTVVTPHVAGISDDSMRRMGMGAVQTVRALWNGERAPNLVQPRA